MFEPATIALSFIPSDNKPSIPQSEVFLELMHLMRS